MLIMMGMGALLVIVGIAVLLIRRRSAAKQAASMAWPTCDGRVTRALVESSQDKDGRWSYSADIAYGYTVNGQSLSADRVAWGGRSSGSNVRDAEAMVARYPVGTAVRVHYNPEKPAEAVLEPADTSGLRLMLVVSAGFIVVGLVFLAIGPFVQN